MSIRKLINLAGQYLVPFKNPRVVCPPGPIPKEKGRPVVIASMMRSGTHLAIDMLLNNFPSLINNPLYLDVDQYFRKGKNTSEYLNGEIAIGRCIVKTHYPQSIPEDKLEVMKALISKSDVILLHRPAEQTFKSLKSWGMAEDFALYKKEVEKFYTFWESLAPNCIHVEFNELVEEESFRTLISNLETKFDIEAKKKISLPVNPRNVWKMAVTKLSTRLLGRYSPVINTGIRSGMTGA